MAVPGDKKKSRGKRCRVDVLVVERGLAPTRSRAQSMILAGTILGPGDRRIEKPGELLAPDAELRVKGQALPFVSRGGLKLQAALQHFEVPVDGAVCLDIGASTGGFTDCLLQRGASKVYAVDVGYGQMAWSMRQDPRVIVIERENIRHVSEDKIPELCSVVVVDVSFISLKIVLPAALRFTTDSAVFACLVKPQFEVGPKDVGKGGIVREPAHRQRALDEVCAATEALGMTVTGTIDSPIVGAKGNHEFMMVAHR